MLIKAGSIWGEGFVDIYDIPETVTRQQFEQLLVKSIGDRFHITRGGSDDKRYFLKKRYLNRLTPALNMHMYIIFVPENDRHDSYYRECKTKLSWAQFVSRYDESDDFS